MILIPTYRFVDNEFTNSVSFVYSENIYSSVDNLYDKTYNFQLRVRVRYIAPRMLADCSLFKRISK